ncbi:RdgB/HAM1 family non-canonical purine NTP pyrophosphatase [Pedobacter sp. PWIIR3]
MLKELVFATNNDYKAAEVSKLLAGQYKILSLKDIGCLVDIPETGNSFEENAALKTAYVVAHYHIDCFGDDSGLEVEALNNEPGIFSARYSGNRGDLENMNLLLKNMEGVENRKAHFRTVISLNLNRRNFFFEGLIEGTIKKEPLGNHGFGYDPVFVPLGYNRTFAQMSTVEKNEISHRAIAMNKLIAFLKDQAVS